MRRSLYRVVGEWRDKITVLIVEIEASACCTVSHQLHLSAFLSFCTCDWNCLHGSQRIFLLSAVLHSDFRFAIDFRDSILVAYCCFLSWTCVDIQGSLSTFLSLTAVWGSVGGTAEAWVEYDCHECCEILSILSLRKEVCQVLSVWPSRWNCDRKSVREVSSNFKSLAWAKVCKQVKQVCDKETLRQERCARKFLVHPICMYITLPRPSAIWSASGLLIGLLPNALSNLLNDSELEGPPLYSTLSASKLSSQSKVRWQEMCDL